METSHCEPGVAWRQDVCGTPKSAIRCSLIVSADSERPRLAAYIQKLAERGLPEDYEVIVVGDLGACHDASWLRDLPNLQTGDAGAGLTQAALFDGCVRQARGTYVLLIRQYREFDPVLLAESVDELRQSGGKVSVSATGTFVLAERAHYLAAGGFRSLLEGGAMQDVPREACVPVATVRLRNLQDEYVQVSCGQNTVIDPEVIVDSPEAVRIGSNCVIRKGVVLRPEGGEIVIGDNCVVNHYCVFHGKGGIYLGDWTVVAPHCGFYAQNHTYERFDVPITRQPNVGKGIYLMGDNWIGAGAIVCDDVTIGKGAVVGANATVTRSMPMAVVAAGSPARVIKKRCKQEWDFQQRERAAVTGMPGAIMTHVQQRGRRIADLTHAGDVVLDVGCGEGIVTAILRQKCRNVVGCDYSMEAVNIARRQCPGLEFVYSNSTALRFPDNVFTTVILSEVAEHLMPVQFIKTLHEVCRVLRSGGTLILATPLTGKGRCTSTYAHLYEYSVQEMDSLLKRVFDTTRYADPTFGLFLAQKRGCSGTQQHDAQ